MESARNLAQRGRKLAELVQNVTTLRESLTQLEKRVVELERRAAVRPADVQVERELGVHSGVVGGERHYFCPVCAATDKWVLLQHEPREKAPWRCPACNKSFPGGATRVPRPSITSIDSSDRR
jgi:hypothetical protein